MYTGLYQCKLMKPSKESSNLLEFGNSSSGHFCFEANVMEHNLFLYSELFYRISDSSQPFLLLCTKSLLASLLHSFCMCLVLEGSHQCNSNPFQFHNLQNTHPHCLCFHHHRVAKIFCHLRKFIHMNHHPFHYNH